MSLKWSRSISSSAPLRLWARALEVLLGAFGKQQAVRQVDQRIVVGELVEFFAGALQRREVGEHGHVMAELALIVMNAAQVLPLRVHLAIFAAVPDFAAPLTLVL